MFVIVMNAGIRNGVQLQRGVLTLGGRRAFYLFFLKKRKLFCGVARWAVLWFNIYGSVAFWNAKHT